MPRNAKPKDIKPPETTKPNEGVSLMGEESKKDPYNNIEDNVSARLSNQESEKAQNEEKRGLPVMSEAKGLDLSTLSREQLRALKSALDAVPVGEEVENDKHTAELREIDGKVVVNFSTAFKKLVHDAENRVDLFKQHIEVFFDGEEKGMVIPYVDFMSAQRITCEIVDTQVKQMEKVVGKTMSAVRKVIVPMKIYWQERIYTLKLPNGNKISINSEKCN